METIAGRSYHISKNETKTWLEAKEYCQLCGGYLLRPDNEAEGTAIKNWLGKYFDYSLANFLTDWLSVCGPFY